MPVTTTLSTKGQVILPKSVRTQRKWKAGQRFEVEDTPEGVLLRPEGLFPRTRYEDVYGSAGYIGPPKIIEEMDAGIVKEVLRRHARGRY